MSDTTRKLTFPSDFVWGAATASYQIEGATDVDGRGTSIWDTFSATPGKTANGDTGEVACDHYHRYRDDIALMKSYGLKGYRFSIAWPRIIPQGTGTPNEAGLDFYERLVDALLENGIQPFGTLYHWDLPQALEDKGGWPSRDIVEAFVNYADVVTRRLSDRVKHWMTFNEPWVFTFLGYGIGVHAPGRADFGDYLQAAHHQLLAHGRSVDVIRANGDTATQVGAAINLNWADPLNDTEEDRRAAAILDGFERRWFMDPVFKGEYPADMVALYEQREHGMPQIQDGDMAEMQRPLDFLGINYYTRSVVTHDPDATENLGVKIIPQKQNEHTEMDWEVTPESLYNVLKHTYDTYQPKAIYITENGAAFVDEVVNGEVDDPRRVNYYQQHLANCHRALQDGVPLKGYFAWTLMDNYEWAAGYTKRFGITYVDYETQQRIPKSSAKWYQQTIKDNGFLLP